MTHTRQNRAGEKDHVVTVTIRIRGSERDRDRIARLATDQAKDLVTLHKLARGELLRL